MNWQDCLALTKDINSRYGMPRDEDYEFIYNHVVEYLPDAGKALELGVCHGRTAATIAYIANRVGARYYGIDNWSLEGSLEEVQNMFLEHGLTGTFIEGDTYSADFDDPIDVLLIDGDHRPEGVALDCFKYLPLLKSGGIVIFDDWDDPYDPEGCHEGVRRMGELYTKGWEDIAYNELLKVIRKP